MDASAFRIVHLSDLHLTAGDDDSRSEPRLFGSLTGMNTAFRQILQSRTVQEADLVLVTGDVTDRGEKEAWQLFWDAVLRAGLLSRMLVLPGNHDLCCLGLRMPSDMPAWREDLRKAVAGLSLGHQPTAFPWAVSPDPAVAIFGLNSNNLGNSSVLTNAMGELRYYDMVQLANLLYKHRDVPVKIVALHHSPNIPEEETALRRQQAPIGALRRLAVQVPQADRRTLRLLCIAHRVRAIVHGHLHIPERRRVTGIEIIGAPASTEPIVQDGRRAYCLWSYAVDRKRHRIRYLLSQVDA